MRFLEMKRAFLTLLMVFSVESLSSEIDQLLPYVDESRMRLAQALVDAQAALLGERQHIYVEAMQSVLENRSSRPLGRRERVLHSILRQGLQLVHGESAVLAKITSQELRVQVLKQSIEVVIEFDRARVQKDTELLDVPYVGIANARLRRARGWVHAIFEGGLAVDAMVHFIRQWLEIMLEDDNVEKNLYAEEIVGAERLVRALEEIAALPKSSALPAIRETRRAFRAWTIQVLGSETAGSKD